MGHTYILLRTVRSHYFFFFVFSFSNNFDDEHLLISQAHERERKAIVLRWQKKLMWRNKDQNYDSIWMPVYCVCVCMLCEYGCGDSTFGRSKGKSNMEIRTSFANHSFIYEEKKCLFFPSFAQNYSFFRVSFVFFSLMAIMQRCCCCCDVDKLKYTAKFLLFTNFAKSFFCVKKKKIK